MFKVEEIIKAAGGKILQGNPDTAFKSISTDSRTIGQNEAFLALKGNNFDGHKFIGQVIKKKVKCLIVEEKPQVSVPGSIPVIKVKDTTKALGDIAHFNRNKFNIPVIAVTGSNGKTTTKEMIAWILSSDAKVLKNEGTHNNQIGLPQTLIKLSQEFDYVVTEIGTNHFGEVDYLSKIASPNIGIITNIGSSHLKFFKDLKGVLKEKTALLNNLAAPGIGILCADDKLLNPLITKKGGPAKIISFGIDKKSDFYASQIRLKQSGLEFKVNGKNFALSSLGYYNIYNALCAICVGRIFGMGYPGIVKRLSSFKFPKGRLNLLEKSGLRFIDDTYNSNPLSLKAALAALRSVECKGRKIFVMGDMLELGRQEELLHRQSGSFIASTCDLFVAVGKLTAHAAREAIEKGFKKKNIFFCSTSEEARELLFEKVSPGHDDVILVKGSRSMKMEEVLEI